MWKNGFFKNIINQISDTPFVNYEKTLEENNYLWDSKKDIAFKFKFNISAFDSVKAKFKRQKAKFDDKYRGRRLLGHKFIGIQYDIDCYGYQAKEVLQVNRDYWKNDFITLINKNIIEHLNSYLSEFDNPETSIIKLLVKNIKYDWSFSFGWLCCTKI